MTTPALAENVKGKGRHYRHPNGELVPSITNIIGVLNKPALPRWAALKVAEQAVAMRDSLPKLDEEEAVTILKQSPWRSSTRAADRAAVRHNSRRPLHIQKRLVLPRRRGVRGVGIVKRPVRDQSRVMPRCEGRGGPVVADLGG